MMSQQQRAFQPPKLYSIFSGEVTRIEPYGCFVKLSNLPISGLVHISQLYANAKVANVSDVVVSINDYVNVKVIDVKVETIQDDQGKTRQRHKVKLSMKYVQQDTGQDLDPENDQLEEDLHRNSSGNRGGGSWFNIDDTGANSILGRALVSNIGMSTAIDPGNLILRGTKGVLGSATADTANGGSFNGSALVGEDEGEARIPPPVVEDYGREVKSDLSNAVKNPMGRGRGLTLPAWMTRCNPDNDKLGSSNGKPSIGKDGGDVSKNGIRGGHSGSVHRNERDKRHTKHKKERSNHGYHLRRGRERSRSKSYSSYSSSSSSIDSRSPSAIRSRSRFGYERHSPHSRPSNHRKNEKKNRKCDDRRSRHGENDHRRWSQSPRSHRQCSPEFASVEEARAVVEQLERRR